MVCLQVYRELMSLATFLRVHSSSKEVSYLCWQNTCPNLKTTCHIKLKFFLWTKLLENLLLAKYLISVAAPLIFGKFSTISHYVNKLKFKNRNVFGGSSIWRTWSGFFGSTCSKKEKFIRNQISAELPWIREF